MPNENGQTREPPGVNQPHLTTVVFEVGSDPRRFYVRCDDCLLFDGQEPMSEPDAERLAAEHRA